MTAAQEKIEPRFYELKEAVEAVKQAAFAKYDESVDLAIGWALIRNDRIRWFRTTAPRTVPEKARVLVFAKG